MNTFKLTALTVLAGTGLLSALISPMCVASEDREEREDRDAIVGTWVCDGGPVPFKVNKIFNREGTMMEVDNVTFQESPTVGIWKRTGTLHFFLVARQFAFEPDGTWSGTFYYSQPLVMDPSRKTMTGTFHARFVDPNGNSTDAGDGAVSCSRMTFKG